MKRLLTVAIAGALLLSATTLINITNQGVMVPIPAAPGALVFAQPTTGRLSQMLIGAGLSIQNGNTLVSTATTGGANITKSFYTYAAGGVLVLAVTGFPCVDLEVARNGMLNYQQNFDFSIAADGSTITYPALTPGDFIAIRCAH